jgi:hypothetical protein
MKAFIFSCLTMLLEYSICLTLIVLPFERVNLIKELRGYLAKTAGCLISTYRDAAAVQRVARLLGRRGR